MPPNLVPYLLYEPEESGILWIKFNRPERMNALIGSSEENGTVAKVGEYMRAGDDDPDVRVIVLTGVGRGFCSGADMRRDTPDDVRGENFVGNRSSTEGPDAAREHFFHGFTKLHRDISLIRKPTIAMVNGPAVGSGMDMALHCDIRPGLREHAFHRLPAVGPDYRERRQLLSSEDGRFGPGAGVRLHRASGRPESLRLGHAELPGSCRGTGRTRPGGCATGSCGRLRWCSGSASGSCVPRWTARWRRRWR